MNFVGKFDAQQLPDGFGAHSRVHVEHPTAHAPADAIIVPDAHLLFGADFKRSGVDLILSNADRELIVHDYFKGEYRHPLASPDGAHLTGDIVNALAAHVEYAQAGAPDAAAHVIGHVTKLSGSATAVRNGVSVILNNGDNVEKGDVVATGSDSTLGVTFIDGTVFGLSSNARMVLNEMVYDPNGSNNSSLISLVAGTISFVAGETAKHGDMKVDTPVATMGIRGTAVLVEIDFNVPGSNGLPDAKFQVLVEPDGHTGSYILFDKTTLDPIATVNKAGQQVNINQNGISYTNSPLSPELQKLISDVFQQKFSTNDTNTKTFDHFTDSVVPPQFQTVKGPDFIIVTPVVLVVNSTNNLSNGPSGPTTSNPHIPGPPAVATTSGTSAELTGLTGSSKFDTASGIINYADINAGDQPTASTAFKSFTYQDGHHNDITTNLTPTELAAVKAIEVSLDVKQDPAGINHGTAIWTYSVADGALDFLGAGETLTLTYLVTVNNNFAPSPELTTLPITITITGTNDVPVITSSVPQTIAFSGGTSVQGGDLKAHVPTSGTITFDDPDLTDTHTVSVSNPTSTLTDPTTGETTAFVLPPTPLAIFNSALTASITDATTGLPTDSTGTGFGSISWSLAELPVWLGDFVPKDEVLTLTYVVTVTDSQGAISQQDITVTITGTDTPAVVWIATTGTGPAPDGLWSTGGNWETGNAPTATDDAIIITDQLEGLTPTYPVTITSAAVAHSLEMDNFGGAAPVLINQSTLAISGDFNINDRSTDNPDGYTGPELDNHGTVTIGGAFNLNADSIVDNSNSITVTGKMEVLDQSTVQNSGTIKLAGGGDFGGQSTISNTTTDALIEVSGGTLNVGVDISNSGTVQIDSTAAAALTLASATIDGGTVTNKGTLTLNGDAVVQNGTLGNSGHISASGTGNELDNEKITNTGSIEVVALGALTLDLLTGVTNTGHTITVDGTVDGVGTLTLQGGASITGGNLSNSGAVDIEGSGATLDGVTVTGPGAINVDVSAQTTLVLEGTTGITDNTLTVGPTGTLSVAGSATLDHVGVTNQNSIDVTAGHALALDDGSSVDNTSGTITVDGTATLTLNDASIDGGTINDFTLGTSGNIIAGDIDVTGSSTISNAHLNNGHVTLSGNVTLTLDGSTITGASFDDTASGATIQIDGGDTLTLNGATINGGTINAFTSVPSGSVIAADIDVAGSSTISNAHLNNGHVTVGGNVTLTLDGSTVTGASFDDTASGATIQIDGGDTLTLNDATINGGTINAFTSVPSGSVVVADIDVTGSSTISNAHLNNGNVTLGSNVTLNLTSDTVAGVSFNDTASGAIIQIVGNTVLDDVTISGGTVHNSGITVDGGQTLKLQDGVTVSGGTLSNSGTLDIESSAGVTLDDVTITGGGVIQIDPAIQVTSTPLVLQGGTSITDGTLTVGATSGSLAIKGTAGATLDHVGVTNDKSIEVFAGSLLTLDDGTTVANGSGTLTVDGGATLALNSAEITGGTINNFSSGGSGTIKVTGASQIDGDATLNDGAVTVEGVTLTLDNVTVNGTTFDDTASGATIQIDGNDTLTLNDATINGGTINAFTAGPSGSIVAADIDVTGSSAISNAALNHGNVTLGHNVTLKLDGSTVTGTSFDDTASGATIQIDGNDTLTLSGAAINGGTINAFTTGPSGSIVAADIDVTGSSAISNAALNHGNVTLGHNVTLNLDGSTVTGTSFDDTASGATIQIDGNDTLTLNGANFNGGTIDDFSLNASGSIIAGDIDVTGSSGISNAHLNNGDVTLGINVHLGFDNATVTGTSFDDTADGATIDVAGTLTLNDVSIDGGTVHNFSTLPGGQVVADTIHVTGDSTISHAALNGGDVTIDDGVHLTLDGSTVTGTSFDDTAGGIIQVDGGSGDTLALSGAGITGGGLTVATGGLVQTSGNVTLTNTVVTNDGTIEVTAGTLTLTGSGSVADSVGHAGGTIQIDGGAVLDLDVSDTQNVSFSGTGGELKIDTSTFGGNIVGLDPGDQIDLSTIGYGPGTTATYVSNADDTGGTLTVTDGTHSIALQLVGDYTDAHFAGSADGNNDLLITLNANDDAPVFASGETAQTAAVAETTDVTGSSATDNSTPTGGAIHFTDIDLTNRQTATYTQSVTWTGGTLSDSDAGALEQGFHLTAPITNTNNGEIDWTYSITDSSLDFLGAGQSATVTSTITLTDQFGGKDTATVTVTVDGANDIPTIAAANGGLTEAPNVTLGGATDTATGTINFTDADVTDHPSVTASFVSAHYTDVGGNDLTESQQAAITALETALTLSANSGNANNGSYSWTYSVADSALDFMAAGDKLVLTYNATVNDGHIGGTATTPVTVTITGADDLPSISGDTSGAVADGGATNASGVLVAADPDRGDSVTWSVVGGTSVAPENYDYGLEDLKVVKNGTTIFHDTFTGTAPPNGPNFLVGTTGPNGVYGVSGGSFVAGATATQLEGADAAPVGTSLNPSTYGDVVFGQYTTLFTGTSFNSTPGTGLRSGEAFNASAVFDLDNPADNTTHYGLRLSDRVNGSTGGTNDQPGTETVDLHVEHNADGSMSVQLNEIDFETGTSINLQTVQIETGLTQGITDNAIQLNLSNAILTNGHITASFQLFGINGDGTEVADGGPVTFTATGQIFDNEDWTRVQVYGQSVGTSDTAPADVTANAVSVLQGTYGTLDVNEQTGTWQYFLNPGLASVKALAAGQTAIDHFTIAATDTANGQTTQAVNVTVTGIDDAPTLGAPTTPVSTDENHAVTISGITVSDVDAGSSQIEVTLAAGHGAMSLADYSGLDSHVTNNDGSIALFGSQAAINTALSHGVIYTPGADYSGADTLTVTANDQVSVALGGPLTGSEQIALTVVPGTPVFTGMTMSLMQGDTEVLSDSNFSIVDPDTSHFLYTVSSVTGGQFEVSDGTNWTAATSFTTQQVEAGHVEFVQDGTATAPNFSIVANDGANASAPITPTVNFTPTPPVAHDDVLAGPSGDGWVLDTDNGHYYREVATFGSFETAVAGAAADGGYLATITSAAEQSFVVNHVIDGVSATWLGGETNNDRPDDSTVNASVWSWVTGPEAGTQFSYTNWNPGEPSGGFNATTQWLQIGATGGWNDAPDAGQSGDGAGAGYLEEWGGTSTQITFLENTGTSIATSVLLANDTDVNGLPLTVTAVGDSNGHSQHGGTVSLNGGVITYTPSTNYSGADSFSYTISDGSGTSTATVSFDVQPGTPVVNTLTIAVLTAGGVNFDADSPLSQMGSGIVQPGDDSSFTILDSAAGHKFVFDGSGFSYDGATVTGGTISAIHELTTEGNTGIVDFTGLNVSATAWIAAVQQAAGGDYSAVNSLVANDTVDFVGGSGPDHIGSTGHNEIYNGGGGDDVLDPGSANGGLHVLTGGAGSDTFVYQLGYGAVTITDFDQGNNPGVFDATENDKIELNGFSNQPAIQDDGHGNVTADFGSGDVLTFLNVTAAELNALNGSEIINGGGDNGGNGNGPVVGNAGNSITYQGSPVLIDPAVTLTDSEATVSSVNVWISSGEQNGDRLTINGATDGTIANSDGSTISYHFDATLNTSNDEGHGFFLTGTGATLTTADFEAALQLIQFSSISDDPTAGGTDTSRTITWAGYDNIEHSSAVTTTVTLDVAPVLHGNLIVNGGFETSDFAGWTIGGDNASGLAAVVGPTSSLDDAPNHGANLALFGSVGDDVTLSQTVATTAAAHYTVDFWLSNDWSANPAGGSHNDFGVTWNGTALMPTIVDAGQTNGYTEYQFDVTGTGSQSTLEFSARNDGGYWNLDDVSVRDGAPDTVQQMSDQTTSVSGVSSGDTLTITAAGANPVSGSTIAATAGAGTIEWQFEATNSQLDHLIGMTQSYTVAEQNNPAVSQTVAVSVGGPGNDQFTFSAGVGADTMLNFSTITDAQGHYAGDTVELSNFTGITSVSDVLAHLSTDTHGNAVVDLGNHDSITFQGVSVAVIQTNASHIFQV